MVDRITLGSFLASQAGAGRCPSAMILLVQELAQAAKQLSTLIGLGPLAGDLAGAQGSQNCDGDVQKKLDVIANACVVNAAERAQVAFIASEELDAPLSLNPSGPLALAIDPLDGSSNIGTNAPIGTIFSVLPAQATGISEVFLQPGSAQLAAGFFIYGSQTALVLTLGSGVAIFVLDRKAGEFVLAVDQVRIPADANEYAINASNYRHWEKAVRAYIDDCVQGADGPRGKNFNMRWIASLVAEAYRILMRGGIFLYPRDQRTGYRDGRLRLVYEANPVSFIVEQAAGAATDGAQRILELRPTSLHQRTPLVFGSARKVEVVTRYHTDPISSAERSPLFARRGLLRA
jgi:fructose-1,6-bisphosphatase I